MKKSLYLIIAMLGILFSYLYYKKREQQQLGKVTLTKPPKIRIVYSKKLKPDERTKITSSNAAIDVLRKVWSSQIEVREEFVVLLLDRSNRVLGYHLLSKGGISGTIADIRLIYAVALESLASAIIIAHNHPSGNIQPSNADLQITKRIVEAVKYIDISVLDHIILTKDEYFSFGDEGRL